MNECDLKMLTDIYQNTSMGIQAIEKLEELIEDMPFSNLIYSQKHKYIDFNDKARTKIREFGKEPEEVNLLTKLSSQVGMNLETFVDTSVENIAGMLINGNSMGVNALKKELISAHNLNPEIKDFSNNLIEFQLDSISKLQDFCN